MTDTLPAPLSHADNAAESLRAIAHMTKGQPMVAPTAYELLGNLKVMAGRLDLVFTQIASGLERSLTDLPINVYEDDGGEPAESIATARLHLDHASALGKQLEIELATAQSAIAHQGFRP